MSVGALDRVLTFSQADGGARLVIIVLAEAMNFHDGDEGWETCWLSKAAVGKRANLSERQVQRCIQELVELGELIAEPHPYWQGRADRRPNRYRLRGDILTPRTNAYGETYPHDGETSATERGDTGVSQTIKRTMSKNHEHAQFEPAPVSELFLQNQVEAELTPDEKFDLIWREYPQPKKDRTKALQACKRQLRQGVPMDLLLQATQHYHQYVDLHRTDADGTRYVMNGATFFNGRWQEHQQPPPDAGNPKVRGKETLEQQFARVFAEDDA